MPILKLLLVSLPLVIASFCSSEAIAAHSSYSPMAPRQISVKAREQDYSYGLTVLPGNSIDSIEWVNRNVGWKINYVILDGYILRPVAHTYAKLPEFSRTGVHNFFSNITDLNNTLNNLLYAEFSNSGVSLSRFCINSTVGVLGLFDVASALGIEKKELSMNTLLGKYGVDQGAYLMVPGMGPATERSLNASAIDKWPYYFITPWGAIACFVVNGIDERSRLIPQEEFIDKSIDSYAQLKQVYLMYQEGKVNPESSMQNKEDKNIDEYLDEIDSL